MSEKRLPPLPALRAFAVAARLGAFTAAAERLGVSQSAVTRQIAALEASLGTTLFHRGRRGVGLTPEGRDYAAELAPAFEMIEAATARVRRPDGEDVLRLRVYPVFAVKWLIPRLADFAAWAPKMRVELDTSVEPVDFERSPLDAAIQFGGGDRGGGRAELLIPDEIEPVCSPSLLAYTGGVLTLDDLLRFPLLHARYRRADWRDWAIANGRPDLAALTGSEWPSSVLTYQAAQEGLGFAMGQTRLLQRDFDQGVLVRPFNRPLRRPLAYHLILPTSPLSLRVRAFRAWLLHALGTPAT
jgi:LysR family glycine cleavage system transcriptional activator